MENQRKEDTPFMCKHCPSQFVEKDSAKFIKHYKYSHPSSRIPCNSCDFSVLEENKFTKHLAKHLKNKCNDCGVTFSKIHEQLSHENAKMKCKFCPFFTCKQKNLDIHMKNDHKNDAKSSDNQSINCDYCTSTFLGVKDAHQHVQSSHPEFMHGFQCNFCDKKFGMSSLLETHTNDMHPQSEDNAGSGNKTGTEVFDANLDNVIVKAEPFEETNNLNVSFLQVEDTVKDMAIKKEVIENTPKVCSFCDKAFPNVQAMKKHIGMVHPTAESHSGNTNKKYKDLKTKNEIDPADLLTIPCKDCKKVFKSPDELKAHMESVHKKFQCDTCLKTFGAKHTLKKHKCKSEKEVEKLEKSKEGEVDKDNSMNTSTASKSKNGKMNDYLCEFCSKSFKRKELLTFHKSQAHKGAQSAPTALKKENPKDIKQDKAEKVKCDFCDKTFVSKTDLESHVKLLHNSRNITKRKSEGEASEEGSNAKRAKNEFSCDSCSLTFPEKWTLKVHVDTAHKGIKSFNCEYCPKTYKQMAWLGNHVKKFHSNPETKSKSLNTEITKKVTTTPGPVLKTPINPKMKAKETTTENVELTKKRAESSNVVTVRCGTCNMTFPAQDKAKEHIEKFHQPKKHICNICHSVFPLVAMLRKHFNNAHPKSLFNACDLCKQTFNNIYELCVHVNSVHKKGETMSQQNQESEKENRGNVTITKLNEQKENKPPRLPFKCNMCEFKHEDRKDFIQHVKKKHRKAKYPCNLCKFVCNNDIELIKHQNERHPELNKCNICNKAFTNHTEFEKHQRMTNMFSCKSTNYKDCEFQACVIDEFKSHVQKNHEGPDKNKSKNIVISLNKTGNKDKDLTKNDKQRPNSLQTQSFKCVYCQKDFSAETFLENHKKTCEKVLKKQTSFACKNCDESFQNQAMLLQHGRSKAKKPQPCKLCGFKSCTNLGMDNHLREKHTRKDPNTNKNDDATGSIQTNRKAAIVPQPEANHGFVDVSSQKSHVNWKHYLLNKDQFKAKCKYCPQKYSSNSTVSLGNHLKNKHPFCLAKGFKPTASQLDQSLKATQNKKNEPIAKKTNDKAAPDLKSHPHNETSQKPSDKSDQPKGLQCDRCDYIFDKPSENHNYYKNIPMKSCSKCYFKSCTKNGLDAHVEKSHKQVTKPAEAVKPKNPQTQSIEGKLVNNQFGFRLNKSMFQVAKDLKVKLHRVDAIDDVANKTPRPFTKKPTRSLPANVPSMNNKRRSSNALLTEASNLNSGNKRSRITPNSAKDIIVNVSEQDNVSPLTKKKSNDAQIKKEMMIDPKNIKQEMIDPKNIKKEFFENFNKIACERCDMNFEAEFELNIHQNSRKMFTMLFCEDCYFKSCTTDGLMLHYKSVHPDIPLRMPS